MGAVLVVAGCQQPIIDHTDRAVYRAIEQRQRDVLGVTSNAHIGPETGEISAGDGMYSFVPHPIGRPVPESLRDCATPAAPVEPEPDAPEESAGRAENDIAAEPSARIEDIEEAEEPAPEEEEAISPSIFDEHQEREKLIFGVRDALTYAMRHARDLQNAKEDLYLAALDLTLERHLWTPQFVASLQGEFADYGQVRDFDRAMSAVSSVAVSQRLPYGGEVTAQLTNSLMRDLGQHVTSGETGTMILQADLPLFRGAGRAAYESRYQAERELIYAVRAYERFRRSFVVRVAGEYFALQQSKAQIDNAYKSYLGGRRDWEKAEFKNRMGRSETVFDALRARSRLRSAQAVLVSAKERYASALDQFKIFIGMPVGALLDVLAQEEDQDSEAVEALLPDVDERTAVSAALRYRLDLLNSVDWTDDARRGVAIAKNRILPDLDVTGSVTMSTDPNRKNSLSYNTERTTWRAGIALNMDDRATERSAYRQSLVDLRRTQRDHEEFLDSVRADVRRALRRIDEKSDSRQIRELDVDENVLRAEAARAQFDLGLANNQDVIDAENDLLGARNALAGAVADYRVAILEFWLSTGLFRVSDDGRWQTSALCPQTDEPQAPGAAGG